MKKIFVAYADEKMAYSLKRIGRQAKSLGFFDEIRLMTPADLSQDFKSTELMQYSYGGGYWAWKPYIINKVLQENEEGTVVCYVDSGCTLRKHSDWDLFAKLMMKNDTILFEYPDQMDIWEKFGSSSTKIKHWTKKQSLDYYDELTGDPSWKESNKIWGGCLWIKGKNNPILSGWLDIVINRPDIIMDAKEDDEQYDYFAQHKHDQSLLVALANKYNDHCLVLPETAETCRKYASVNATRVRAKNYKSFIWLKTKDALRKCLGGSVYSSIKRLIKKK
ncbi:MAG: hypothetical protein NC111_02805 [Bacteroides sp.]|nr:hypothetical protein [Bacteroides sp.]MCM1413242.1 hypothetical protein [Bacteroides sp.]MCM1471448.1 hypothetical protein [Bacteroides sp.]